MNNKLPQIHIIYNRYKKASDTQQAILEIRVTHNYQQRYFSTGIWLYPNQWKSGKIINHPDILHISKTLELQVSKIKQIIFNMMEAGELDISKLPRKLSDLDRKESSFTDFCNQRASIRKYGKRKDTQERYNRFLRLFSSWGKINSFDDINDKNIVAYDKYLSSKGMKNYSKWQNYHRFLNGFIIDAINEGLLVRNPYKWINIEKDKNSKGIDKCLTPHEFRILQRAQMPTKCLERVRDLFVFQTYTCMSYSDLRNFDYNLITDIKGMKVYTGKREKTDKPYTIPLLQPALDILEKYKGFLPIISNVKYNQYLKLVAQAANIEKPLSTHWARHTGATILLNEGIDMRIVARICGHSSTRITEQIYAKLLDETVVDAIKKKEDNLK